MWSFGLAAIVLLLLAACGSTAGSGSGGAVKDTGTQGAQPAPQAAKTDEKRTIRYLDQDYTVPAKAERIVITGAMEAMEDALVLDVKPVGAITFANKFPPLFAPITGSAKSIGAKSEPNYETILQLKPDVILGTTKFKPEVVEQLKKIAPLIQVSHIATNWEANITMLGELTGKQDKAKKEIEQYKADLATAKKQLTDKLKDKKVVAVRVRSGEMYIYPESVFVNPVLYTDLGLTAPAEIKAAKAQELISIEKFAAMNPDHVFMQFSEDENADKLNALKDLQNNPILKNVSAFKNGAVYVNAIDPLGEGGPAWSRINFLKQAVDKLNK